MLICWFSSPLRECREHIHKHIHTIFSVGPSIAIETETDPFPSRVHCRFIARTPDEPPCCYLSWLPLVAQRGNETKVPRSLPPISEIHVSLIIQIYAIEWEIKQRINTRTPSWYPVILFIEIFQLIELKKQ